MLRRILLLVTVAAVMLTMSVAPAFAGIPRCQNQTGIVASEGKAPCVTKTSRGPIASAAAFMFPGTGGATPIAPVAAAMLLGTGVVALAVIRRR